MGPYSRELLPTSSRVVLFVGLKGGRDEKKGGLRRIKKFLRPTPKNKGKDAENGVPDHCFLMRGGEGAA